MNSKTYSQKQVAFAERVSKAMASVPEEKRSMLEIIVESVMIGASITSSPMSERPGAGGIQHG